VRFAQCRQARRWPWKIRCARYDGGPVPPPNQGLYPPGAGGNGSPSIEVFGRREFGGRSITLTKNAPNFENFGFNDRVDAAIVRRTVWRCTDARMQGNCRDFGGCCSTVTFTLTLLRTRCFRSHRCHDQRQRTTS